MPPNVGEGLLDDPIQVHRGRRGEGFRPSWQHVELGLDRRSLLEPRDQVAHRVDEGVADGFLAPQVVEELAEALENFSRRVLDRVQLLLDVVPANRFGLEVFEVDQHARQGLSYPIVELTRHESP